MSKGILYIATEWSLIDEAKLSAKSIKNVMPNIPIALVTAESIKSDLFDIVIDVNDPSYSFKDKPKYISESPFDKTVYLDTDTYVYSQFDELFELLDEFEIAAVHDKGHGFDRYREDLAGSVPICYAEYNTGVIAYNSEAKQKFSKKWLYNYKQDEKKSDTLPPDQPSFRRTAYSYNGQVHTLQPNYNCLFRNRGLINGEVKIFHGRLSDISTMGADKPAEVEDAINVLNRENGIRIYDQYMGVIKIRNYNPNKVKYFFDSLYNRGIQVTLSDTVEYVKQQWKHLYSKAVG